MLIVDKLRAAGLQTDKDKAVLARLELKILDLRFPVPN